MIYTLRDYQQQASDAAINFFRSKRERNGILVLPTGAGKSLVIADIANRLDGNVLVFRPSKEILEQNFDKLRSYGVEDCSIYSASFNSKEINRITFATIGSVKSHMEDFNHFRYIIVDECHGVNPQGGMYKDFFDCAKRKILGLTATPYRLTSAQICLDENGRYDPTCEPQNKCILKFLTRTRPRVFHDVIYQVEIQTLLQRGYLSKLNYYDMTIVPQEGLKRNTTGMDFDEKSLFDEFQRVNLQDHLLNIVRRLQHPKSGIPRKGILVFTKFLEESENLCRSIDDCEMLSGETPKKERERIIRDFKSGKIKVLTNVGVLTTGFDYPELDTVVMARPTMSLTMYYQILGRAIRPHPSKEAGWIVDLCGNIKRFGKVEDLRLFERKPGEYFIQGIADNQYKQLTNTYF
ncbi:MAG: DEAD/DEAH box helicase [Muribaculaceae bacterium]|nr:DEAD/DEAH box helicase [Muribaculaceae bacterium]